MVQVAYNFDGDELYSARLAAQPAAEVIRESLADSPHPPLHYFLLSIWERAFGAGEVAARALSILCSAAFLAVAYCVLRRLMAPWPALGALGVLAVSPFFVYYGQQARCYSLIALLWAMNLLVFWRLLDAPMDRGRLLAWASTCALLSWAQYLAVLPVAVEIVFLLPGQSRRHQAVVLTSGVMALASVLPWLIAAMSTRIAMRRDPLSQIGWMDRPQVADLAWFYIGIFGVAPGFQARWLLLALASLCATYYAIGFWRRPSRHAVVLTVMGVVVPAVVFALSFYGPKPVFAERQLIGAALAFVTLTGVWAMNQPRLAGIIMSCLFLWTAAAVPNAFPANSKPPWREVANRLDADYPGTPILAAEDWVAYPVSYYRRRGEVRRVQALPSEPALLLCRPTRDAGLVKGLTPLRTWAWGRASDNSYGLALYEVNADSR
ncbi:glycosyltransferase family 39 protein [Aquisphaera giovannonii]|nr:glycosyltransferase family 39 protein [Aquisphaera giovannonii]